MCKTSPPVLWEDQTAPSMLAARFLAPLDLGLWSAVFHLHAKSRRQPPTANPKGSQHQKLEAKLMGVAVAMLLLPTWPTMEMRHPADRTLCVLDHNF